MQGYKDKLPPVLRILQIQIDYKDLERPSKTVMVFAADRHACGNSGG